MPCGGAVVYHTRPGCQGTGSFSYLSLPNAVNMIFMPVAW
jgi:hypothetical protein